MKNWKGEKGLEQQVSDRRLAWNVQGSGLDTPALQKKTQPNKKSK